MLFRSLMNDVIGKGVIALHTIQEMSKSRVKQLNRRGNARPGSVCLVAAVIDRVSDLGFCVIWWLCWISGSLRFQDAREDVFKPCQMMLSRMAKEGRKRALSCKAGIWSLFSSSPASLVPKPSEQHQWDCLWRGKRLTCRRGFHNDMEVLVPGRGEMFQ